jgi:hypothetical protein
MTTERSPGSASGGSPSTTSPAVIAVAWLVVGVPAAWGVFQTGKQATALFQPAAPTTVPATTPAAEPARPGTAANTSTAAGATSAPAR